MKIDPRSLEFNKEYTFTENVDFSNFTFSKNNRIKCINSCNAVVKAILLDSFLELKVSLSGEVTGICSYTNEEFPIKYKVKEQMTFSDSDDSDYESNLNEIIDLDPYFLSLIDSEIPISVVKPGNKMPKNGDGYRVLSEDDLLKERNNSKSNSVWATLDDIDL